MEHLVGARLCVLNIQLCNISLPPKEALGCYTRLAEKEVYRHLSTYLRSTTIRRWSQNQNPGQCGLWSLHSPFLLSWAPIIGLPLWLRQ